MFKPGDKVKCIETIIGTIGSIHKDHVYTVKSCINFVLLEEHSEKICNWSQSSFVLYTENAKEKVINTKEQNKEWGF